MRLTRRSLRASIEAIWLGRLRYEDALNVQHKFVDQLIRAKGADSDAPVKNFLLLLEHTPVYTVGLRSHVYSKDEEERLKALGADFYSQACRVVINVFYSNFSGEPINLHIVPCGLVGKEVTSLSKELKRDVTVNEAIGHLYEQFADVFQCDITFRNALEDSKLTRKGPPS
ncbi:Putative lipoyltransferase 2, mitochondrial [Toxocara canis]|uniref:Putative lipoyltransferase 2, mitochondrial n=1 Tax=Toxocara canis TaxID=6265 RepID=A0A0B2UX58_TOXCA|nr:Putative lipoyltransferase 2, mitochondrial [Toxocara canis]